MAASAKGAKVKVSSPVKPLEWGRAFYRAKGRMGSAVVTGAGTADAAEALREAEHFRSLNMTLVRVEAMREAWITPKPEGVE